MHMVCRNRQGVFRLLDFTSLSCLVVFVVKRLSMHMHVMHVFE